MMVNIRQAESFFALPDAWRNLVVYSEGAADWPHLSSIVWSLLKDEKYPFVYLTSDSADPGLKIQSPLVKSFLIGAGGVRTSLFAKLKADVMVMTLPDLENLSLKRSPDCNHYVYIFHSPVSTHMIYQAGAFDHFDTIFCAGPHHEIELQKRETLFAGKKKKMFRHGYGRLDTILANVESSAPTGTSDPEHILVAPSWGPNGIFETIGTELVNRLLEAGFRVTASPHPQTVTKAGAQIKMLLETFGTNDRFVLDTDMRNKQALYESGLMISDWSGAALDYAFGLSKPVLFIDTARKVNNPDYEMLDLEPLEVGIRNTIGRVLPATELDRLPNVIRDMTGNEGEMAEVIAQAREQWIFNVGRSGPVGARELVRLAGADVCVESKMDFCVETAAVETARTLLSECKGEQKEALSGDVLSFFSELIDSDETFSLKQLSCLEKLCRKIDITKKISTSYDEIFERAMNKAAVDNKVYPALILAYILAARQIATSNHALGLKLLNSAGNALDIYVAAAGNLAAPLLESLLAKSLDEVGLK